MSKKSKSGGGIRMSKNVNVGVKAGPPRTNKISEAAVDQLGQATSFRRPDLIKGTMPQVPLGNALATNVGAGGPGTGRTTLHCGTQGTHGGTAKGEGGIQGKADSGNRAILGPPSNTGAVRRGQQSNE
jgi:hypothetical protein